MKNNIANQLIILERYVMKKYICFKKNNFASNAKKKIKKEKCSDCNFIRNKNLKYQHTSLQKMLAINNHVNCFSY